MSRGQLSRLDLSKNDKNMNHDIEFNRPSSISIKAMVAWSISGSGLSALEIILDFLRAIRLGGGGVVSNSSSDSTTLPLTLTLFVTPGFSGVLALGSNPTDDFRLIPL